MWKYNTLKYFYPLSCLVFIIGTYLIGYFSWWILPALFLIWSTYIAIGAFNLSSGIFVNAICKSNLQNKVIMLTFDDGPDPLITNQILAVLKEFNAKALFFCIGKNIEKYPELVIQLAQEGHWVANHTYHHSNFTGFFSVERIQHEIEQTEKLIFNYTQQSAKLFRPPFGVSNPAIAKAVERMGYKVIGWNIRSFDTISKNKDRVLKRISGNITSGDIVLFHDTMTLTPLILREFMLLVINKGFTFGIHSEIVE